MFFCNIRKVEPTSLRVGPVAFCPGYTDIDMASIFVGMHQGSKALSSQTQFPCSQVKYGLC